MSTVLYYNSLGLGFRVKGLGYTIIDCEYSIIAGWAGAGGLTLGGGLNPKPSNPKP